ncbi:MAG: glycosyltransferase family 10 [Hyphomicrobiaceae bacterium]
MSGLGDRRSRDREIIVKVVVRGLPDADHPSLVRQLPADRTIGACRFLTDPAARGFDWLVVYDDLPRSKQLGGSLGYAMPLDCPRAHTLLVTSEPSSVNVYGRAFISQFGHVLSSQEPWAIPHPRHIHEQCGLVWFYGIGRSHAMTLAELAAMEPPDKPYVIATVCSSKQQQHTLHNVRYAFTQALKTRIPELEIFGHGVRAMDDKAEAVAPYKYHVAIENHIAPHHFTEKLTDPFLGYALPFYAGAPNATDYFPPESFVAIDMFDVESAARAIRKAIDDGLYEQRLPAIRAARRLVLERYGYFQMLARHIARLDDPTLDAKPGDTILSRRAARRARPLTGALDLATRAGVQVLNRFTLKGRAARLAHGARQP